MILRRSMLFVPGFNAGMISNCFIYDADAFMFDLEDSVALAEKDTARMLVAHALKHPLYKERETVVRVNPLSSEFGEEDIKAVVRAGVDIVRLPKTDDAKDIIDMDNAVTKAEEECGREIGSTDLLAAIETAKGVLNVSDIATASPRLMGIALGAEDYVRDMKTDRSSSGVELHFARSMILHAARANGLMAFDTVFSDVLDIEGFIREASLIKQMGFDGKSLVNPSQIPLLHNIYAPTQAEVDHAQRVIAISEEAKEKGAGVVSLNGKMVDAPIIERAKLILQRAKAGISEDSI